MSGGSAKSRPPPTNVPSARFNHFKVKVGGSVEDDRRRLALVRSIIDDPKEFEGRTPPAPETLVGKNAGPTGSVLMIDANQVR